MRCDVSIKFVTSFDLCLGSSVVEQMTENHCVESSILSPGT